MSSPKVFARSPSTVFNLSPRSNTTPKVASPSVNRRHVYAFSSPLRKIGGEGSCKESTSISSLPNELVDEICRQLTAGNTGVVWDVHEDVPPDRLRFYNKDQVPLLAHLCHYTREFMTENNTHVFILGSLQDDKGKTGVWFSPDKDTLYFSDLALYAHFEKNHHRTLTSYVQGLDHVFQVAVEWLAFSPALIRDTVSHLASAFPNIECLTVIELDNLRGDLEPLRHRGKRMVLQPMAPDHVLKYRGVDYKWHDLQGVILAVWESMSDWAPEIEGRYGHRLGQMPRGRRTRI